MLGMRRGFQAAILALAGLFALSPRPAAEETPSALPQSAPAASPAAQPPAASQPQSAPARPTRQRPAGVRPTRPPGPPQRDPRAEEVLRAVVDADGGEEYLRGIHTLFIRTRQLRGEGEEAEESLITQYWKEPNRYRREVDSPRGLFVMSYNGKYAWNDMGQGVTLAAKSSYRDIEDIVRDINEPLSHLDAGNSLAYEGEKELDGRKVDVVRVTRPSGKIKRLYVEREQRTVLMREIMRFTEPDKVVARRRFSDFRKVDKLWVAFLEEDSSGETLSRLETVNFIPNQAIDDRLFDSPLPPYDEQRKR